MLQVKEEKSKVKEEAQEPQTELEIKTEKQVRVISAPMTAPPTSSMNRFFVHTRAFRG
jgi:hypothetical protein